VAPDISFWVPARGVLVGFALGVLGALFCPWQIMRVPLLSAISRA
jgi:hypothetical protein